MSIVFSDTSTNTGIVQQVRKLMQVDATQWPTANIVASVNNWLDTVCGYAIGADRTLQWDDTNHTGLPEGTAPLTINVAEYSYLQDEQLNSVITLTGISVLVNGIYVPLKSVDRNDANYDSTTFGTTTGTPTEYDKIADNIIRLNFKPSATVSAGIKFFFQRSPSYFVAADTTKTPGVAPILHRGFVISAAYDGAITLGLPNAQSLALERQVEENKMVTYFSRRNNDDPKPVMRHKKILYI